MLLKLIVPEPGQKVDETEILDFCKGRLAKFKTPSQVMFLAELPKGDSGKILKRELSR